MWKILLVWFFDVTNRIYKYTSKLWYLSLFVVVGLTISLLTLTEPVYFTKLVYYCDKASWWLLFLTLTLFLPSREFGTQYVLIKLGDESIRYNWLVNALRQFTNDIIPNKGVYDRIFTKGRIRLLILGLFLYDFYKKNRMQLYVCLHLVWLFFVISCANYVLQWFKVTAYYDHFMNTALYALVIFAVIHGLKLLIVPSLDAVKDMAIVYVVDKFNKMQPTDPLIDNKVVTDEVKSTEAV